MSTWQEIRNKSYVELSGDGETIEVLYNHDHNGNNYIEIPIEFVIDLVKEKVVSEENKSHEKEMLGFPVWLDKNMWCYIEEKDIWTNGNTYQELDVLIFIYRLQNKQVSLTPEENKIVHDAFIKQLRKIPSIKR